MNYISFPFFLFSKKNKSEIPTCNVTLIQGYSWLGTAQFTFEFKIQNKF